MSVNTVNGALRRLGYARDEMTGHGFRAMACTCLNELGWHPDLIELQLAHAERRKMMQAWADYLDGLRGVSCATHVTDETNQRANASACPQVRAQTQRSFQNSGQKKAGYY